jgi:hypothetical protein
MTPRPPGNGGTAPSDTESAAPPVAPVPTVPGPAQAAARLIAVICRPGIATVDDAWMHSVFHPAS